MGALANAVALLASDEWKNWITAASAYTARLVYSEGEGVENHAVRLALAKEVANQPDLHTRLFLTILSTDPAVCSKGATPTLVTEQTCLDKVAEYWTFVAIETHPTIPHVG